MTRALERFRARALRLYLEERTPAPTLRSVGRALGRSKDAVRRALLALGAKRRPHGGARPRAPLPGCPVCGRMRVARLRCRTGAPRLEYYCRYCQARSGARWREANPERFAAAPSRAAARAQLREAA